MATTAPSRLTAEDYRLALASQTAVNASGLVRSLAEVMPKIRETLAADGVRDTGQVNTHPIAALYVAQLCHLAGLGMPSRLGAYEAAYQACQDRSLETRP